MSPSQNNGAVSCLLVGVLSLLPVTDMYRYWDYIIIGAGPAGLQMAHFLDQAGREYVVFERNNVSGSFYLHYPRHGRLISINKRHTGKTNREFNLRHDWNSLISDRSDLLFTQYSKEFFPDRAQLQTYFQDYEEKLGLNVVHNTAISNISREWNYTLQRDLFLMLDQHGNTYACRTLFLATGMSVPNIPLYKGIEHVEGYESIPTDPEYYEGKSVLILGHGNSAFETADAIYGHSSLVHVVSRSRVRLAWETHYVGDLRSVNNGLLDTYQLKSMDGVAEGNLRTAEFVRQSDGRVRIVAPSVHEDNFPMRDSYDIVIRCLGFQFDNSIFTNSSQPARNPGRLQKYPAIYSNLEAQGVPNMYVIGTAAHSIDYRKSAGGFIHGFRYMVRALHRRLEWKEHRVPWPAQRLHVTDLLTASIKRINEASGIYQMFGVLGDVIILHGDGTADYLEEYPIEELHLLQEVTGRPATRVVVMVMQYGANYSGPGKDTFRESRAIGIVQLAHLSNFLHPVFYYYDELPTESDMSVLPRHTLPRPTRIHHMIEDFLTTWTSPIAHLRPLRLFLQTITQQDLREYFATNCLEMALLHQTLPATCSQYFLNGRGLVKYSRPPAPAANCSHI